MLVELRKVIPSFLSRIDRPERGGVWTEYLESRREEMDAVVHELWPVEVPSAGQIGHAHRLRPGRGGQGARGDVLPVPQPRRGGSCPARVGLSARGAAADHRRRTSESALIAATGPGGLLSALHTGSTSWRTTGPSGTSSAIASSRSSGSRSATDLGFEVPPLVEAAGLSGRYLESLERSKSLHDALAPYFPEQSALRGRLGVQHPFRLATERPRGDARPRAPLGPAGPSRLPKDRPGDAPAHRRAGRPPRDSQCHELRRPHRDRARSSRGRATLRSQAPKLGTKPLTGDFSSSS